MQKRVPLLLLIFLLLGIPSTLVFARSATSSAGAYERVSNPLPEITPSPAIDESAPSGPPLSLTLSLLCFCLAFSLVIGVFVLGFIVRMPSREDKELARQKDEHGI
jgi:hypothetical protein